MESIVSLGPFSNPCVQIGDFTVEYLGTEGNFQALSISNSLPSALLLRYYFSVVLMSIQLAIVK